MIGGRIERAIRSARPATRRIPARVNNASRSSGKQLNLQDLDACTFPMPVYTGMVGSATSLLISPLQATFWPKVTDKASQYQQYDIGSIVVEYVPVVGSMINGQMYASFIPQTLVEPLSYDQLQSHEASWSWSVSEPFKFSIPAHAMCQGGKGLLIPNLNTDPGELTRYYVGMLNTVAVNVSAGTSVVGNFRCYYNVLLSRPQLDVSTATAIYDATNDEIDSPGRFQLSKLTPFGVLTPPLSFSINVRRTGILVAHSTTNAAMTCTLDGAPVAASFSADDGAANWFAFYPLPRAPGFAQVIMTGATLTWCRVMEDDVAAW